MSQKHVKPKPPANRPPIFTGKLESTLVLRLVIATLIFAAALVLSVGDFLGIVLLAVAAVAAGYDVALAAVRAVEGGDFAAQSVLLVIVSVVAFFIGFPIEGAAIVLLYQIGQLLIKYASDHTKKAALELVDGQDGELIKKLSAAMDDREGSAMSIENVMRQSVGSVLKIAMFLALVYAIALPIFTNYSYTVSVHRALMILVIASPMSVAISIPLAGAVGLCYSAQQGIVFNSARELEKMADTGTAVFDKAGIFAVECPRIVAMYSDVLDSSTFMNFVAHAVYYSEQPIAKAISAVYEQNYKLDIIKDFREIPGQGVELSIDGIKAVLATKEYLAGRGVNLPEDNSNLGQSYYMVVAGRLLGKVVISSDVNEETENLVPEMKSVNIGRCVLLTEDSKEAGQEFAELMNFTEMYPQCNTERKLAVVKDIAKKSKTGVLFAYAGSMDCHSDADLDLRVSKSAKYADAVVDPDCVNNIPFAKQVAQRVREIAIENALFAFIIKAALIFLSIVGYCNLWFAILIDIVAALATILNTIRVTNESLGNKLKYKRG